MVYKFLMHNDHVDCEMNVYIITTEFMPLSDGSGDAGGKSVGRCQW